MAPTLAQNTQPVQPCLHGEFKSVAQQQYQGQGCHTPYPQQKRQEQGRVGVKGIGDQIAGEKSVVGLGLVRGQVQPVPDACQRVIYGGFVPEGQVHHQNLRPGQGLVAGDGVHLGKLFLTDCP